MDNAADYLMSSLDKNGEDYLLHSTIKGTSRNYTLTIPRVEGRRDLFIVVTDAGYGNLFISYRIHDDDVLTVHGDGDWANVSGTAFILGMLKGFGADGVNRN